MGSAAGRCLVLIVVLTLALGVQSAVAGPRAPASSAGRWPTDHTAYVVPGWVVSSARVENPWGSAHFATRRYQAADGQTATLTIKTSSEPKEIYRTGVEVPLQGNGYQVEPAAFDLVTAAEGRGALLARGARDQRLVLYAYGEKRGLVRNDVAAWTTAALDSLRGAPNVYYLLVLTVPLEALEPAAVTRAVALGDTLFLRLAAWYAE